MASQSDHKAAIIDGKAIAQTIRNEIAEEVRHLSQKYGKVCFFCSWVFDVVWWMNFDIVIGKLFRSRDWR